MKILLIHPNKLAQRYISTGIGMISAVLKKTGHQVSFFDTSRFRNTTVKDYNHINDRQTHKMEEVLQFLPVNLPPIKQSSEYIIDALHKRICKFQPDLIGITATSSEVLFAKEIVSAIQSYSIPIILGGAHATVAPIESLSIEGIQMILQGEGEEAIVELANSMQSDIKNTNIANIYFKEKDCFIQNEVRPYIRDLDQLPFVDLSIFDKYHSIGAYQGRIVTYGRFEAGRGCPFKCTYCINDKLHQLYEKEKNHIRYKSPSRFIKELEYGLKVIQFDILRMLDETFTAAPIEWLDEFIGLYKDKIDKPLVITTRPEMVNRKKMELIREANSEIQVTMGIESGSEHIRRNICNRHHSNDIIIKAYRLCHDLGFRTASFNMIGLPEETRKDFFKTIELNRQAGVQQPMLSYFYPFPGTLLRDDCISEGYIDDKIDEVDYAVESKLCMPQFTLNEIEGLKQTFALYVKMDKSLYPEIEQAEHDEQIFKRLVEIYNKKHHEFKI